MPGNHKPLRIIISKVENPEVAEHQEISNHQEEICVKFPDNLL